MSAKISACWISSGVILGFVLFVRSEHFYLPKENNVFSGDPKDDWIPVSGIDKRSTRFGAADHGLTRVVHITPPVRYPPFDRPQAMETDESNKVEVFAQPPPTILGSFSDFGHATVEAREPAHALNFRPSAFDRLYDEVDERRFRQQNDYRGEPVQDEQKPPAAIVVFNAQQRHPQNYHKTSAPTHAQYYQNFQYREVNNKNAGYNKEQDPPRRLAPYLVPNEHVYPRPAASQGNNKQTYVEQRPKPYPVNPSEPIHQHHNHHHHHHQQQQQQQQQQHHQKQQQQSYKLQPSSTEGGDYFQKYHPGRVVESQNPYPPQVSTFARPFELQTGGGDRNVFIRPDQYVQDLNVGTEVRFAAAGSQEQHGLQQQHRPSSSRLQPAVPLDVSVSTAAAGFAHPATRPFSKYQTPTPKNEELYRIFPVKEVNALPPTFLPTPITLLHDIVQSSEYGRPKTTTSRPVRFKDPSWDDGSSEYEAQEQDENESGEQLYDVLRSPTKPVPTTTTTTTTTAAPPPPPRATRKRKPTITTTTTTTTTTVAPDEYDEYAVPNRQQLQLQEQFQPEERRETTTSSTASTTTSSTAATSSATASAAAEEERPLPVSVNKYKKKKPLPATRPKEPQPSAEGQLDVTPSPSTVTTTTATTPPHLLSQSSADTAATDTRTKIKAKYGNGTRPRFSIKDYKTSTTSTTISPEKSPSGRRTTTTTTTTAEPATVVEQQTARKRYRPRPNRYKTGTSTTASTTTSAAAAAAAAATDEQQRQETATAAAYRSKYKPGGKYHNRLRTSTESAAQAADVGGESVAAATEPTRPTAVYSAKRRTVPTVRTADAATADEHNAVRRSSSASPLDDDVTPSEPLDAASSEDVDYVATTVAVTPVVAPPRHKYHTSYAAERPLLPIESFFQSSMAVSKRYHNHNKR